MRLVDYFFRLIESKIDALITSRIIMFRRSLIDRGEIPGNVDTRPVNEN